MSKTNFQCPVEFTTRVLGGKWKPRLIWLLIRQKTLRFSELRKGCPPISDRILTKELKELEAMRLISRKEYPVVPRKTEYELTELGLTLVPLMQSMADWGLKHNEMVPAPPALSEV
ncbi:MAG TPA: helix-turn-helix domain-containing protein [Oculatellaceae cyanobacterium]